MATSPLTNATVAGHPIQHKPSIHYLFDASFLSLMETHRHHNCFFIILEA
ncbi:hypothetical protein COLO4_19783 [Corchorus olitorius]|uniref:Uncharacterized protein n=1 Tax=Corchorus olitorius TaxID=93759 RepID=A0A1R3J3H0_9ROSI|nr:hypothetical protein COLO4_19783 [Corchorus olitorius]